MIGFPNVLSPSISIYLSTSGLSDSEFQGSNGPVKIDIKDLLDLVRPIRFDASEARAV
jgi:hypothetical protein